MPLSWLPAIEYPTVKPGEGYWEPVTSTINWCEEDYYATIYSAEIVNTITNLAFVLLAIRGIISCRRENHDTVFLATFAGYAAVGTGSFLFHNTLKYPMQLVDELSMIYTMCFSCYASFSYNRSPAYALGVATVLLSLSVFITGYYHYLQDPLFHQRSYGILTAVVLFRGFYVMERNLRASWGMRKPRVGPGDGQGKGEAMREQKRIDERDRRILNSMWTVVGSGLAVFLLGFAVWNLDNKFCGTVRRWRHTIGLPWGILLEGHGWWHLFTGLGAYFSIVWAIWLRHCLNGKQDEYELVWPSVLTSLPEIRRVQSGKGFEAKTKKLK